MLQVAEALLRQSDLLIGAAMATLPLTSPTRLFLDSLSNEWAAKHVPGQVHADFLPSSATRPGAIPTSFGMFWDLTGLSTSDRSCGWPCRARQHLCMSARRGASAQTSTQPSSYPCRGAPRALLTSRLSCRPQCLLFYGQAP